MKVMCIGQAAYDITLPVTEFPIENKKIRVSTRVECGGGSSSNAAYLLSKWGMDVYFAGVIGNDTYGNSITKEFEMIGVNTKYLEKKDDVSTTASYIICNTSNGKRTILTNRKNNLKMTIENIDDNFDVVYLDGYEGEFSKKVLEKCKSAIKIIDAGSLKEQTVELCKLVDYVVCSKDFAEDYTNLKINYDDFDSIVKIYDILENDFKNKVIITLEEKGCFIKEEEYIIVPSIKVNPIDTTGAGDIFHAAFTYFISNNYNILDSMKLANITAAMSTEKVGSRNSIFSKEEVMEKAEQCI